jgi:hypothetical protein
LLQAELGSNSAAGGGLGGLVAGSLASLAAGGKDGRAVILAVDQSYAAGAEVCCSYGVSSSQVWSPLSQIKSKSKLCRPHSKFVEVCFAALLTVKPTRVAIAFAELSGRALRAVV